MKKFISFITTISLFLTIPCNVSANETLDNNSITEISYLENGDYIETYITINDFNYILQMSNKTKSTKEITKTKTSIYKNKNGVKLWDVSITATFTYNGSTSKCISCSHNSKSYANSWKIKSVTSHKKDNYAIANAIASHEDELQHSYNETVTITCSKTGNVY